MERRIPVLSYLKLVPSGWVSVQPIVLLPTEDGVTLRTATGHQIISVGQLLLLPRKGDWSVSFQRDMRAVVLSVT